MGVLRIHLNGAVLLRLYFCSPSSRPTGYFKHKHHHYRRLHCLTCWCQLSWQCLFPSLSDNEITENIFILPLAAELHGDALWLGLASVHSGPITLTVSKRLKHVRLFKSNQRLARLFRCIFQSIKNKKPGGWKLYKWINVKIQTDLIGFQRGQPIEMALRRHRMQHKLGVWTSASCALHNSEFIFDFWPFCIDNSSEVNEAWRVWGQLGETTASCLYLMVQTETGLLHRRITCDWTTTADLKTRV